MTTVKIINFYEMVSGVADYFKRKKKFEVKENYRHEGMTVHVYGNKKISKNGKKEKHEILVEVVANEKIPLHLIGKNLGNYNEELGVLALFQIYFHPSKIYLAVPNYATNIPEIKELCKQEGIGLLEVSQNKNKRTNVIELEPAFDRVELFKEVLSEQPRIKKIKPIDRKAIINEVIKFSDHLLMERAVKTLAVTGTPPSYQMNLSRNLLNKMSDLSDNVIYKKNILDFCNDYITQRSDDYKIVVKYVKKLWEDHLPAISKITSSFDFYQEFESILKLDREYRDHFLHQFQVFLLGTFIIDKIIDKIFPRYQNSFKEYFPNIGKDSIYKSWLITSTFHDFAYPLEQYSKWNDILFNKLLNIEESPTIIGFEKITVEKSFLEYLDQIDSFLSCCKKHEGKWACKKPNTTNENLRRFLLNKIVREKNHGVLSSLALLKKCESEQKSTSDEKFFSTVVYPAAVAIAIHDQGIWQPFRGKKPSWKKKKDPWEEEFFKCNYLNHLDFSDQPLSFLLIFCDTAQEFGRPKFPNLKNEFVTKAFFEEISADKDKVCITISVETTKAFEKKVMELNETVAFLKCNEIDFIFRLLDKEISSIRNFQATS